MLEVYKVCLDPQRKAVSRTQKQTGKRLPWERGWRPGAFCQT